MKRTAKAVFGMLEHVIYRPCGDVQTEKGTWRTVDEKA